MQKNKFTTYLLYAIGEIVLVVIGILIAVNLNNWNQRRLLDTERIELLSSLKSDLNQALRRVEIHIEKNSQTIEDLEILLNYSAGSPGDESISDLLDKVESTLIVTYLNSYMTSFEQIKSSGKLGLIEKEELLQKLSDLDAAMEGLLNAQEVFIKMFIIDEDGFNMTANAYYLSATEGNVKPHPELLLTTDNFDVYIRDKRTYQMLHKFYVTRVVYQEWAQIAQRTLSEVLVEIDYSLDR